MQLCVWRNIHLQVPDDWEMLQYSREIAQGKCAFADRYEFRLELNWKVVAGAPDFDRMLSDYGSRLTQEKGMKYQQDLKVGTWTGVGGEIDGRWMTRYGAWLKSESLLVEIVFIWPQTRDVELEKDILRSAGEEPVRHDGFRRWKTFGMEFYANGAYKLGECKAEPGIASMTFTHPKNPELLENFERRGMVSEWLEASVHEWLRVQIPGEIELHYQDSYEAAGHDVERIAGTQITGKLGRYGRKAIRYEATAWICPEDNRLYSFRTKHLPEIADHSRAGERLACCNHLWVGNE